MCTLFFLYDVYTLVLLKHVHHVATALVPCYMCSRMEGTESSACSKRMPADLLPQWLPGELNIEAKLALSLLRVSIVASSACISHSFLGMLTLENRGIGRHAGTTAVVADTVMPIVVFHGV